MTVYDILIDKYKSELTFVTVVYLNEYRQLKNFKGIIELSDETTIFMKGDFSQRSILIADIKSIKVNGDAA